MSTGERKFGYDAVPKEGNSVQAIRCGNFYSNGLVADICLYSDTPFSSRHPVTTSTGVESWPDRLRRSRWQWHRRPRSISSPSQVPIIMPNWVLRLTVTVQAAAVRAQRPLGPSPAGAARRGGPGGGADHDRDCLTVLLRRHRGSGSIMIFNGPVPELRSPLSQAAWQLRALAAVAGAGPGAAVTPGRARVPAH